jgi:hypothetical protein
MIKSDAPHFAASKEIAGAIRQHEAYQTKAGAQHTGGAVRQGPSSYPDRAVDKGALREADTAGVAKGSKPGPKRR